MITFEEFFRQATGNPPYGYQARLARDGLPAVVEAPTGAGKTGVILAWLWRRLHGPSPHETPRRLIYALPQRSLVEQVAGEVTTWLGSVGCADTVSLHVVMGGEGGSQRLWRLDMHRPAIVVGTVDSLVSKALNRGYGISRATYPIDFALVTNGAHWVIDEIQLCPESTTTLRQLAAFARTFGTAEPFGLTCMSATVPEGLLGTVDNPTPEPTDMIRIEASERTGELGTRLDAARTVHRVPGDPGDHGALASFVLSRHRPNTLTLVVVNTVDAARKTYAALRKLGTPATLLHSRFRGIERRELIGKVAAAPGEAGHIVVSTQVVEAGIDLNAAVMVTEAAPWPSVVQRAGRCNRTGRIVDAELWWLPPTKPAPYPQADIDATAAELTVLEGQPVTGESLLRRSVPTTETPVMVLRRPDLVGLFDTAPDLSGGDIDVAPYVRDADELDVQLAWATWDPVSTDGRPPDESKTPLAQYRCRVPLSGVSDLVKRGVAVWRWDQVLGRWAKVMSSQPARPGEVLVVAAQDGGYDPETGFDASAKRAVPSSPPLVPTADPVAGTEDAYKDDSASVSQLKWLSLKQHSVDTRNQAQSLLAVLGPTLRPVVTAEVATSTVTAAFVHDVGKSHPIWQDALCALASSERREEIAAGRPWAKSNSDGQLKFEGGVRFRHELASLLLLDGPLCGLLDGAPDRDLARYLVLAHHGKLRVQVRDPDSTDPWVVLGLKHGATTSVPNVLDQPVGELTVDLGQFSLGGELSWTRSALTLRDRYGPFVLAYLETIVRIADWRASAFLEVAQ